MAKNTDHILHVKSNVVIEGKPKLPSPSNLVEGELAINYAEGVETISIKNASGDIVTFSSDDYYSEQKLGSGFTGENSGITVTDALENLEVGSEVEISSGITPTGETVELWVDESVDPTVVDAYTKAEVNSLLDDKADMSAFTEAINDLNTLSGTVTAHTVDSTIHLTSGDVKTQIDNSISGKADTTAVTESINAAVSGKTNQSDFSTHTASSVHMSSTEKTNLDSLATNIGTISGITSTDKLIHETMNRRTRTNFTSKGLEWFKTTLKSAIADKSLEKYGLKVGDYCSETHDGKTYNYVIAGLNTMRGTSTPYRLNYDHVGIIVDTNDTHAWNTSNSTATSQNTHNTDGTWTSGTSAAGYASCDLQYYLEKTVLPKVESDLGSSNIKSHYKLYSTAVNTSGYNRFGSAGGCSSSWAWYADQKICALSEVQVYGSIVWSSSGYDTGEACRQLDVFRVYNMNEIFEGRYPWLRDVASSSYACSVGDIGGASRDYANYYYCVAALILFA